MRDFLTERERNRVGQMKYQLQRQRRPDFQALADEARENVEARIGTHLNYIPWGDEELSLEKKALLQDIKEGRRDDLTF